MSGKKVVALGVTGGIAAYKAAELCRLLMRGGCEVRVVMTENACRFVTPLTFRTLSRYPVTTSLWETPEWRPEHVALADEAALLVIAPCTANCLGKLAHGLADDALSTLALAFAGPLVLAPAMNPAIFAPEKQTSMLPMMLPLTLARSSVGAPSMPVIMARYPTNPSSLPLNPAYAGAAANLFI